MLATPTLHFFHLSPHFSLIEDLSSLFSVLSHFYVFESTFLRIDLPLTFMRATTGGTASYVQLACVISAYLGGIIGRTLYLKWERPLFLKRCYFH